MKTNRNPPSDKTPRSLQTYFKLFLKNIESFGKYDLKELALREGWHQNHPYEILDRIQKKSIQLPKVSDRFETLSIALESERSISRFGDGEFNLAMGKSIPCQTASSELSARLKEILKSNDPRIQICLANVFGALDQYIEPTRTFWRKYLALHRDELYQMLDLDKPYLDTHISRPYIDYVDRAPAKDYYQRLKQLWNNRPVVIVEGEKTKMGQGNDLLDNVKSIERVIVPSLNAFDQYTEILEAVKNHPKESLFLLCVGPTATVLAYDLALLGFYAIDSGHLDAEYEWFLAGAQERTNVSGKFSLGQG